MSMVRLSNSSGVTFRYINDSDSAAVTNTTSETVIDQFYTLPSENTITMITGLTIRLTAMGTISTGLISLGFRFRIRVGGLGGVILADTGGLTILSSLTNGGWLAQSIMTVRDTGPTGLIQAQNYATMQSGALLAMPTTSAVALDTTIANDITLTAQWTTATANNVFTMRSLFAEVYTPFG